MLNTSIEYLINFVNEMSGSQILGSIIILIAIIFFIVHLINNNNEEEKPESCSKCGSEDFTDQNNVFVPLKLCDNCGDSSEACF